MLLCVYQLHSAAINSLVVFDGFCVTGSDDRQLRVWPMDFSDFLLEVGRGKAGARETQPRQHHNGRQCYPEISQPGIQLNAICICAAVVCSCTSARKVEKSSSARTQQSLCTGVP
jgi:hypothetical protein